MERKGTPSVPVPDENRASGLPYVLTDIMTYFTMLVGIYFPSVTGEAPPPRTRALVPSLSIWPKKQASGSLLLCAVVGVQEGALSQALLRGRCHSKEP